MIPSEFCRSLLLESRFDFRSNFFINNASSSDEQYYLRSIGCALEVLNCFDGLTTLSLKDIVVKTSLPESTLFRVLLTLEKTIVDRHRLFKELEEVRKTGVGYDGEESIRGGLCIGAAVRPKELPVVAAISLSTPLVRMTKDREKEIRATVSESAARIAKLISAQG